MITDDSCVYVYILQSELDQRYYCGHTKNLEGRLHYHNGGYNKSTKSRKPWRIIHFIETKTRSEAMALENRIKRRGIKRFLHDVNANL